MIYIPDAPSFEKEIKGLEYDELFRLGELACEFPRKVVKEILDEKKGNIEEAANVIITAMCDEYLNREEAYRRLPKILEKISECNSNMYLICRNIFCQSRNQNI